MHVIVVGCGRVRSELAANLDHIRVLITRRDQLLARLNAAWGEAAGFEAEDQFTIVQDKLAARVPVLVAAVDAVLALHQPVTGRRPSEPEVCGYCLDAYGDPVKWPCEEYETVTRVLNGGKP